MREAFVEKRKLGFLSSCFYMWDVGFFLYMKNKLSKTKNFPTRCKLLSSSVNGNLRLAYNVIFH